MAATHGLFDGSLQIDTDFELVVRHRGWCRQDDGQARLSIHTTNAALCKNGVWNGHVFGGIGGTHRHSDWQVDFEAAPTTGYCDPSNRYGSDVYKRHSNNYVFSSCGGSANARRVNIDYMIERAPEK